MRVINHSHILRTARAGNPARALQLFTELGLDKSSSDPKALTLKGRLLKDQAKRNSGETRREQFLQASKAYAAAFELDASSYALINAAALAFLSGEQESSQELASQTLAMIERDPNEGETPYWREATRAEALLILGRRQEAEHALAKAIAQLPHAHEDRAATLGQFELIETERSASADWLEPYRPPSSVYFSGLIQAREDEPGLKKRIQEAMDLDPPGFAFGALAAGADIILAEMLVESGALLHVHLPSDPGEFREVSVEPFGEQWGARFDRLIDLAESVETLGPSLNDIPRAFEDMISLCALATMGAALRQASILRSRARALTISASGEALRPDLQLWREAGQTTITLDVDRVSGEARAKQAVRRSSVNLHSVLAISRLGASADLREAGENLSLTVCDAGGNTLFLGAPDRNLALLREYRGLCGEGDEGGAGFLLDSDPIAADTSHASIERAAKLCAAAAPQTCVTDRDSAMVASVISPAVIVEEIGEMRTLQGPISLWSIQG